MQIVAAWLFASPWMLPWLLAAAIPVLIHLWNRRRVQEESWAATRFLLAAIQKHRRRITIEQILLLAIRVLVLLLLALALAEPMLTGLTIGTGTQSEPPIFTVLVIDTTYSMAHRERGAVRFGRAKQQATETVRESQPGDAFALVTMSDPPGVVIREPSSNHTGIIEEIETLELSHAGADLAPVLAEVTNVLQEATKSHPRFVRRKVKFFTDLGRTTWLAATTGEGQQQLRDLSDQAELEFNAIGQTQSDNLAVTRVQTPPRTAVIGDTIQIEVTIENFGASNEARKRIELLIDDHKIGEKYVDVLAGARATASFTQKFDTAGDHIVEARVAADGLELDDSRWLVVPVREQIEILCIQGRRRAADYVALALKPSDATATRHRVHVASEHALVERELDSYDCVFLCNVARVGKAEAIALQKFVEAGGGLVVGLGDLVDADNYNQWLGPRSDAELLPCAIGDASSTEPHYFDPRGYQHPLVTSFRGHERAGLLTVPTWRYLHLTDIDERAEIALGYQGDDAAIVASQFGLGRVLVVSTALSPESVHRTADEAVPWTALPAWPSFPPLMHELVYFATTGEQQQRNITVGESLAAHFTAKQTRAGIELLWPDGHAAIVTTKDPSGWPFDTTTQSGIYRAKHSASDSADCFAVNLDTTESDLLAIDPQVFRNLSTEKQVTFPSAPVSRSLFRFLLVAMVVLLITETLLAWSFGRVKA